MLKQESLQSEFATLLKRHYDDAGFIESAWLELQHYYNQSHRHYHTLEHIQAMFGHFKQVKHLLINPDAVLFAIFYHDVIYDVTDNSQIQMVTTNMATSFTVS